MGGLGSFLLVVFLGFLTLGQPEAMLGACSSYPGKDCWSVAEMSPAHMGAERAGSTSFSLVRSGSVAVALRELKKQLLLEAYAVSSISDAGEAGISPTWSLGWDLDKQVEHCRHSEAESAMRLFESRM